MHSNRAVLALALLATLAGCTEQRDSDDPVTGDEVGSSRGDTPDYRQGVVVINEGFTVASGQPARFEAQFGEGARNVILEIQQDSGAMPTLHVDVEGCGELDPPASGGWQAYPVCDEATVATAEVTISVNPGLPAGSGRFLLRADLPSR